MASGVLQEACNSFGGMKRGIIENDDIARLKLRDECLLHPLKKEIAITVSGEDDGCQQRVFFQPRHQVEALARGAVSWFMRQTAYSSGCPAVRVGFIAVHAGFVHPDTLFFGNLR